MGLDRYVLWHALRGWRPPRRKIEKYVRPKGISSNPTQQPSPSPSPGPPPDPGPVPSLRNAINKNQVIDKISGQTDALGIRFAKLLPDVIDRINAFLRWNDTAWDNIRNSTTADLGKSWEGLFIKKFTATNTGVAAVNFGFLEFNADGTNFGNDDVFLGLVINEFSYNKNLTNLTDEQWTGILLHELLHPLLTAGWNKSANNSLDVDAFLKGARFPKLLTAYKVQTGLTGIDKILTRKSKCTDNTQGANDGTSFVHWEHLRRTVGGVSYPGLVTSALRTCFSTTVGDIDSPESWIITPVDIAAALDVGFEQVKAGSEGNSQTRSIRPRVARSDQTYYELPSYGTLMNS